MTKQKFKEAIREMDTMFMNVVLKDGQELEVSDEQLVFTDEDIARGRFYIINYDNESYDDQEFEIKISDVAEIIPDYDYDDDEDWEDEHDEDEDEDWDDEDEDWDDEDEDDDDNMIKGYSIDDLRARYNRMVNKEAFPTFEDYIKYVKESWYY